MARSCLTHEGGPPEAIALGFLVMTGFLVAALGVAECSQLPDDNGRGESQQRRAAADEGDQLLDSDPSSAYSDCMAWKPRPGPPPRARPWPARPGCRFRSPSSATVLVTCQTVQGLAAGGFRLGGHHQSSRLLVYFGPGRGNQDDLWGPSSMPAATASAI